MSLGCLLHSFQFFLSCLAVVNISELRSYSDYSELMSVFERLLQLAALKPQSMSLRGSLKRREETI